MRSIVQVLDESFELHDSRIALKVKSLNGDVQTYHYGSIRNYCNILASKLIRLQVQRKFVAVCLPKCDGYYYSFVAVLKAGGIYFPISLTHSVKEFEEKYNDVKPDFVITKKAYAERFPILEQCPNIIYLEECDMQLHADVEHCTVEVQPDDPAYLIYTSGTTAKPKGIVIPHREIANRFDSIQAALQLDKNDMCLQFADARVDVAIYETIIAWQIGACLFGFDNSPTYDGGEDSIDVSSVLQELPELIGKFGISVVTLPPSLLRSLLMRIEFAPEKKIGDRFKSVRILVSATEDVTPEILKKCKVIGDPVCKRKVFNGYGPTETIIGLSLTEYCDDVVSIGKIDANAGDFFAGITPYVYHENKLWKTGDGELCVAGDGFFLHYWNDCNIDLDKTKQAYMAAAIASDDKVVRVYRTGDYVKVDAGLVYFKKRIADDRQVKINGTRVELGGIENKLKSHPDIEDAYVSLNHRLVAYIIMKNTSLTRDQLRSWYGGATNITNANFPQVIYVCSSVTELDKIRQGENSTSKMAILPVSSVRVEARNDVERYVRSVWLREIGCDDIGCLDTFYEIGGYSLLLIKILDICSVHYKININLRDIAMPMSVRSLSRYIIFKLAFKQSLLSSRQATDANSQTFCYLMPPLPGTANELYEEIVNVLPASVNAKEFCLPQVCDQADEPIKRMMDSIESPTIDEIGKILASVLVEEDKPKNVIMIGWSFGGVLATSLAYYLNRCGVKIDYVGLIDAKAPNSGKQMTREQYKAHWVWMINKLASGFGCAMDFAPTNVDDDTHQAIVNGVYDAACTYYQDARFLKWLEVARNNLLADIEFRPKSIDIAVCLYVAGEPLPQCGVDSNEWFGVFKKSNVSVRKYNNVNHFTILDDDDFLTNIATDVKRALEIGGQRSNLRRDAKNSYKMLRMAERSMLKVVPVYLQNNGNRRDVLLTSVVDDLYCMAEPKVVLVHGKSNSGKHSAYLMVIRKIWEESKSNDSRIFPLFVKKSFRKSELSKINIPLLQYLFPRDYSLMDNQINTKSMIVVLQLNNLPADMLSDLVSELSAKQIKAIIIRQEPFGAEESLLCEQYNIVPMDAKKLQLLLKQRYEQAHPERFRSACSLMSTIPLMDKLVKNPSIIMQYLGIVDAEVMQDLQSSDHYFQSAHFIHALVDGIFENICVYSPQQRDDLQINKDELMNSCQFLALVLLYKNSTNFKIIDMKNDSYVDEASPNQELLIDAGHEGYVKLLENILFVRVGENAYSFISDEIKFYFAANFIVQKSIRQNFKGTLLLKRDNVVVNSDLFSNQELVQYIRYFCQRIGVGPLLQDMANSVNKVAQANAITLMSYLNDAFPYALIDNANLSHCHLGPAIFEQTKITRVDFSNAYIANTYFQAVSFIECDLSKLKLPYSFFRVNVTPSHVLFHPSIGKYIVVSENKIYLYDINIGELNEVYKHSSLISHIDYHDFNSTIIFSSILGEIFKLDADYHLTQLLFKDKYIITAMQPCYQYQIDLIAAASCIESGECKLYLLRRASVDIEELACEAIIDNIVVVKDYAYLLAVDGVIYELRLSDLSLSQCFISSNDIYKTIVPSGNNQSVLALSQYSIIELAPNRIINSLQLKEIGLNIIDISCMYESSFWYLHSDSQMVVIYSPVLNRVVDYQDVSMMPSLTLRQQKSAQPVAIGEYNSLLFWSYPANDRAFRRSFLSLPIKHIYFMRESNLLVSVNTKNEISLWNLPALTLNMIHYRYDNIVDVVSCKDNKDLLRVSYTELFELINVKTREVVYISQPSQSSFPDAGVSNENVSVHGLQVNGSGLIFEHSQMRLETKRQIATVSINADDSSIALGFKNGFIYLFKAAAIGQGFCIDSSFDSISKIIFLRHDLIAVTSEKQRLVLIHFDKDATAWRIVKRIPSCLYLDIDTQNCKMPSHLVSTLGFFRDYKANRQLQLHQLKMDTSDYRLSPLVDEQLADDSESLSADISEFCRLNGYPRNCAPQSLSY